MEFIGGGPSLLELGAHVAGPFVLARTDDVAVVVAAARAHSTGVHLFIEWVRRRREQDLESWQTEQDRLFEFAADYTHGPGGLEITAVALPEGEGGVQALTVGIAIGGGGLASNEDQMSGWFQVWVTPPVFERSIELTCSWLDFGLLSTTHTIDRAGLRSAAAKIEQLWSDD